MERFTGGCLYGDLRRVASGPPYRHRTVAYGKPVKHWFDLLLDTVQDRKHMEQVAFLNSGRKVGHGHSDALVAYRRA